MSRPPPAQRNAFRWFHRITTRWHDNDVFGHVNNVVYYAWIDTAVNRFLIERGIMDTRRSTIVGVVAETGCRYHAEITYPDEVDVGIAVETLGRSSVRYVIGIFRAGAETASAEAHFVHVYVDRTTMRPVPIPDPWRAEMLSIRQETTKQGE